MTLTGIFVIFLTSVSAISFVIAILSSLGFDPFKLNKK